MAVDSSIALGVQAPKIESPLNALAQVLQVRHLQNQGDMADFQMQQARQGADEQNALRRLLSSDGFDITNPQSQRQVMGISPTAGQALIKGNLDMRKTGAELDEKTFKTANERYGVVQKSLGSLYQDPNLTKDMVVQNGQQLVQAGLITPQMHQQTIAQLPDDPGQLRQFLAQRLKTQLTPEQIVTAFAPKPKQVTDNQNSWSVDENPNSPTYGKPTGAPAFKMQPKPGVEGGGTPYYQFIGTPEGIAVGDARTGGISLGSVQGKPVVKSSDSPDLQGKIAGSKKGAQEIAEAEAKAKISLPDTIAQAEQTVKLVDDLLADPGMKYAVGPVRMTGTQNIPGTPGKDFDVRLDQLKGQQFLQAFNSLKGGGQITEVEGKKATDAISRMNAASSQEAFTKAAREFQDVVRTGVERAKLKAANGAPNTATPPVSNRIRFDAQGNQIK